MLLKMSSDGSRDTSWCRQEIESKTFRSGFDSNFSNNADRVITDQLFWNNVTRQTFWNFLKYGANSKQETIILSLIHFNGILTYEFESIAYNVYAYYTDQVHQMDTAKVSSDMPENRQTAPIYPAGVALILKKV